MPGRIRMKSGGRKPLLSLPDQLRLAGLPVPVPEYRFHPTRKWRFDYAYPDSSLALEQEGGVFVGGRHNHPTGFLRDMAKYNAAAILGWRLVRFTPAMLASGEVVELVRRALGEE